MAVILLVPGLLRRAQMAAARANEDPRETLSAIVFAAAVVEGFVNKAVHFVRGHLRCGHDDLDERLHAFAVAFPVLEDARVQLDVKLEVAGTVLRSEALRKGTRPFRDIMLLIKIRNGLLHPKPLPFPEAEQELPAELDRIVRSLLSRGILKEPPTLPTLPRPDSEQQQTFGPWFVAIQSAEVAAWAVQTAAGAIAAFVECFPENTSARRHLDHFLKLVYGIRVTYEA